MPRVRKASRRVTSDPQFRLARLIGRGVRMAGVKIGKTDDRRLRCDSFSFFSCDSKRQPARIDPFREHADYP